MRQVIRQWIPRFKNFSLSLKYFPDTELLHKVFFLYFRTIARWEKHFDLPYANSENGPTIRKRIFLLLFPQRMMYPTWLACSRLWRMQNSSPSSFFSIIIPQNRTLTVLQDHADSKFEWYLLQSGKREVGRAMNFGQLFADSKYVMWMDGCEG